MSPDDEANLLGYDLMNDEIRNVAMFYAYAL